MKVVCKECNTSFNLEDRLIKPSGSKVRCSRCGSLFKVFPPIEIPAAEPPFEDKIFEEPAAGSGKDKEVFSVDNLDFSEFDKIEKAEEKTSLPDKEFDLSEFDKIFDEKIEPAHDAEEVKDEAPEPSDAEDTDFSDLEKMLETDIREKISAKKTQEPESAEAGDLDLSELESIIGRLGDKDAEEEEGEPEELKFDIEPLGDEIVSRTDDEEEVDFSDLEKMLESEEVEKTIEKHEKSDLEFDLELESSDIKEKADEEGDLDLSELDKMISSVGEPETAGAEKEAEEVLDLEFSDFDSILSDETAGVEKTGEKELKLDLQFDSVPEKEEAPKEKPDELDLDFSEVEKMLEAEVKADLAVEKTPEELPELEMVAEETTEQPKKAEAWVDTIVTDREGLGLAEKEAEEEHPHLEEYSIEKFQNTIERQEVAAAVAEPAETAVDTEKKIKPPKTGKLSGLFLSIIAVLVLIAGVGAAAFFKPFGIEIPFLTEMLASKADEKGTIGIVPLDDSIKGDFVRTKSGNIFVITGTVKNEYRHPRSYISVTGKLFKKGKVPLKSETVYCGNLVPPKDIETSDPVLIKKRLQNRFGDKKSNVKIKPGGAVPFMIIFENVTDELDEYSVEAAGSVKE